MLLLARPQLRPLQKWWRAFVFQGDEMTEAVFDFEDINKRLHRKSELDPICWTEREGDLAIEGAPPPGSKPHSILYRNGSRWDEINGMRHGVHTAGQIQEIIQHLGKPLGCLPSAAPLVNPAGDARNFAYAKSVAALRAKIDEVERILGY
jgi:hypothetical protein